MIYRDLDSYVISSNDYYIFNQFFLFQKWKKCVIAFCIALSSFFVLSLVEHHLLELWWRQYLVVYLSARPLLIICLSVKRQGREFQSMDHTVSPFLDLSAGTLYLHLFMIHPVYLDIYAVNKSHFYFVKLTSLHCRDGLGRKIRATVAANKRRVTWCDRLWSPTFRLRQRAGWKHKAITLLLNINNCNNFVS